MAPDLCCYTLTVCRGLPGRLPSVRRGSLPDSVRKVPRSKRGFDGHARGSEGSLFTQEWVRLLPSSCTGPGCGSLDTGHCSTCSDAEGLSHPSPTQAGSYIPDGQQSATDPSRSGQLVWTRAEKTLFVPHGWEEASCLPPPPRVGPGCSPGGVRWDMGDPGRRVACPWSHR